MTNGSQSESVKTRVLLLVLDKLVLAGALALVGFLFSWHLQGRELRADYQKKLFDSRVEAYKTLLEAAKGARDEFALLYVSGSEEENPDVIWAKRLQKAKARAMQLGRSPSGFGASSGWTTYEDALATLERVELVKREHGLYISEAVERETNAFLTTLYNDVNESLRRSEKKLPTDVEFERAAGKRARDAYDRLRLAIMESLRLKEIILG